MSIGDLSTSEDAISAQRGAAQIKKPPRNRTATAKSDVVAQPEPR